MAKRGQEKFYVISEFKAGFGNMSMNQMDGGRESVRLEQHKLSVAEA